VTICCITFIHGMTCAN